MKRIGFLIAMLLIGSPLMTLSAQGGEQATPTPDKQPVYEFEFPLTPATEEQVREAQACGDFAGNNYPDGIIDVATFQPETACDWAGLAIAHAMLVERDDLDALPEEGIAAFLTAIRQNPALAFSAGMFYGYLDEVPNLVAPPEIAAQPIVGLDLWHEWYGVGGTDNVVVKYHFTVTDIQTDSAQVSGTVEEGTGSGDFEVTIDPALVAAFGPALRDLIPMDQSFSWLLAFDIYPSWEVTLTFADGQTLLLTPNDSNLLFYGAPWQVEIDGQSYTQYSAAILDAVTALVDELGLPWGQTVASTSTGDPSPLYTAFPTPEPIG